MRYALVDWFWTATFRLLSWALRPWLFNTPGDPFTRAERVYLWFAANALNAEECLRLHRAGLWPEREA
jgi:hypothetical protein